MSPSQRVPALLCCLLLALALSACTSRATPTPIPPTATATATPIPTPTPSSPPTIILPADDAPHSAANTEWWYYNGHFTTAQGNDYGFHYVIFQVQLPGLFPVNMAQAAITDHQNHTYLTSQLVLPAKPIAGQGFSLNLGNFSMAGYNGTDQITFAAQSDTVVLSLSQKKPPALHGGTGVLDFGQGGQVSYYSRTRMEASGTLATPQGQSNVTGEAWFDHEWGTFQPTAIGWDWFSLQLDDNSEAMLQVVYLPNRTPVFAGGTFVDASGKASNLSSTDFQVTPTGSWTSPASKAIYPMGWQVTLPAHQLFLTLIPYVKESEFDASKTTLNSYWEGEVAVSGSRTGKGFVELVGYAPPIPMPSPAGQTP